MKHRWLRSNRVQAVLKNYKNKRPVIYVLKRLWHDYSAEWLLHAVYVNGRQRFNQLVIRHLAWNGGLRNTLSHKSFSGRLNAAADYDVEALCKIMFTVSVFISRGQHHFAHVSTACWLYGFGTMFNDRKHIRNPMCKLSFLKRRASHEWATQTGDRYGDWTIIVTNYNLRQTSNVKKQNTEFHPSGKMCLNTTLCCFCLES